MEDYSLDDWNDAGESEISKCSRTTHSNLVSKDSVIS